MRPESSTTPSSVQDTCAEPFTALKCAPQGEQMNSATIVSWNIWEGMGAQIVDGVAHVDTARLEKIRQTLNDIRPDVVVLNEALWCQEENGFFIDYKRLLGFEHSVQDLYDKHWGNMIVSHRPLDNPFRFRIHNRGGLRVNIGSPALTVATYHPHPSRYPAHKAQDFQRLLEGCVGPTVVCGDFNAVSPEDVLDEVALTQAFASFSRKPASDVARFTEGGRAVFNCLTQLGFSDAVAFSDRHPTIPTDALNPKKDTAMRIDHAWHKDTQFCRARVWDTPLTQWASDHLPLVIKVKW